MISSHPSAGRTPDARRGSIEGAAPESGPGSGPGVPAGVGSDLSSLEVLASLGEIAPDSPVIIVTANPTSDNAIAALRLDAFDFTVKVFKNEVMLTTVARAMDRRRLAIRNQGLIHQLEAKIQELLAILAEHSGETYRLSRLRSQP